MIQQAVSDSHEIADRSGASPRNPGNPGSPGFRMAGFRL